MPADRRFFVPRTPERGRHVSFNQPIDGEYAFHHCREGGIAPYNRATQEIHKIIKDCRSKGRRLRARGSLWSLSRVAVTDGALMDTTQLRIPMAIPASQVVSSYPADDRHRLMFMECGMPIRWVNERLRERNLSLPTSGSNNGQTLVGAFSTGTHGAAYKFGSLQDCIVGMHIITGPATSCFVQRQSRPIVRRSFANALGADFIEDDTIFNAALVSFGSFGIIHGVVVEARDLFLLHAVRFWQKFNQTLKNAIETLDPQSIPLPTMAQSAPTSKPHHFEVIFNPNEGAPPSEASVLLMFEGKVPADYLPPPWDVPEFGPGANGLAMIGLLSDVLPAPLLRGVLNSQVRDHLKPYYLKGIIGDLFRGEVIVGKAMAASMAVPQDRALESLDVMLHTYKRSKRTLPCLFDLRFVKGTKALLGFTRYADSCVVEFDSVNTKSSRDFFNSACRAFENAGIPFTLHWGKFNPYLSKTRVRAMYGDDAVDDWITSRETLLDDPAVREMFSNPFTDKLGLTGH